MLFRSQHSKQQLGAKRKSTKLLLEKTLTGEHLKLNVNDIKILLDFIGKNQERDELSFKIVGEKLNHAQQRYQIHRKSADLFSNLNIIISELLSGNYAKYSNGFPSLLADLYFTINSIIFKQ